MSLQLIINSIMIFAMLNCINPMITVQDKDIDLCSENAGLIWRFTWRYFKKMHAVAINSSKDSCTDFADEIVKCSMLSPELSVKYSAVNLSDIDEQPETRLGQGEAFYPHQMYGVVLIKQTVGNIAAISSATEPDANVIMILTNTSTDDVINGLKLAWSEHKMLDLVIIWMKGDTSQLFVSIYDPFIIKNDIRGLVHTFLMTTDDHLFVDKLMQIMKDRLIDIHGYPLKVIAYDKEEFEDVHCDLPDCVMMHALLDTLNAGVEYHEVSYGGELEELENGYDDMAANTVINSYYGQYCSVFLFPVDYQGLGFMAPKMQLSSIVSFVEVFSPLVSAMLALSYAAMVIAWRCLNQYKYHELIKHNNNNARDVDFVKICCVTLGNFVLVSQPSGGDDTYRRHERCLLISWLLFSMIICCSYQGTMVEHLTAGGPSRDIDTLEQLAASDIKILLPKGYKGTLQINLIDEAAPGYYGRLLEHAEDTTSNDQEDSIRRVATQRDVAVMFNTMAAKQFKLMFMSHDSEDSLLHLVQEEFFGGYASLTTSLDCPYKERFNGILMKCVESGLRRKWLRNYDDYLERRYLMSRRRRRDVYGNPANRNDVYRMRDLAFVFWCWLGCCGLCCLVFIAELLMKYKVKCDCKMVIIERL